MFPDRQKAAEPCHGRLTKKLTSPSLHKGSMVLKKAASDSGSGYRKRVFQQNGEFLTQFRCGARFSVGRIFIFIRFSSVSPSRRHSSARSRDIGRPQPDQAAQVLDGGHQ